MIRDGHVFYTSNSAKVVVPFVDNIAGLANVVIDNFCFDAGSLRELRKFLKKLQRQLEQADLDNCD